MKRVIFAWPPINTDKGFPTIAQNRQFQYFKDQTSIYPMIASKCATMLLSSKDIDVLWLDAIAERLNDQDFAKIILKMQPTHIVFEASTPVIKRYYEVINGLKMNLPNINIILCGEHATALPDEAKKFSKADHIVVGGDWYNEVYRIVTGGRWPITVPYPIINREKTRWWLYAYKNGNYKYIPATYIMAAEDCWHRPGCTFCSWGNYHKGYTLRPVEEVLNEVGFLTESGFKEIFDDSGTFPPGEWLRKFCKGMIDRGYDKHIAFSCNMRFGVLEKEDFVLMANAGFRMILWGLESASQETLNRLNKKVKLESIYSDLIFAKAAGLQSHLTCMFGFPWESYEDAFRTYNIVKYFLLSNYAFSAQATICIPYPGTKLFEYCKENQLLKSEDWNDYDMTKAIMKVNFDEKKLFELRNKVYNLAFHPKFIFNRLKDVRDINDLKYYFRIGRKIYNRFGEFYQIGKLAKD